MHRTHQKTAHEKTAEAEGDDSGDPVLGHASGESASEDDAAGKNRVLSGRLAAAACRFGEAVVDFVLPPRCPVTGAIVDRPGMVSPATWRVLDFIAAPFCARCGVPFEFETAPAVSCAACLADPPHYDRARSAVRYDSAIRDIVLKFKHGDGTALVHSMVPWLLQAGASLLAETDMIVPVPLHQSRLIARRYNQSALLAAALARRTEIPCGMTVLRRVRATPTQGTLGHRERYENVRRAFDVSPTFRRDLSGRDILLVDDVLTTGATVNECARALKAAGAGKVFILTVARAVRN